MPRGAQARDVVGFSGGYAAGTVVVRTSERSLYYVLGNGQRQPYRRLLLDQKSLGTGSARRYVRP